MKPTATVAPWVTEPLRQFVADTRALFALILERDGRVLGQHGFTRAIDVMGASTLAAAIHASGAQLGRLLQGRPLTEVFYAGSLRQIFIAELPTDNGSFLVLAVLDGESSLGLARLYLRDLRANVAQSAPVRVEALSVPIEAEQFERDLQHNLTVLFSGVTTPTEQAVQPRQTA